MAKQNYGEKLAAETRIGSDKYKNFRGTPYLEENFTKGSMVFNDSIKVQDIEFRYNIYEELMEFRYNDVIFSNVEFSDFIALQSAIRTNRGYIKTKDNNGNILKLYPTVMKYDNLSKELNIKGEEKYSPTTLVQIAPVLTTKSALNITGTTATSGGYIKTNGGSDITSKGIVWSLATNPTIALTTKTNDGIGSVDYKSYITGLYPSRKYYVKSYATNVIGTSYGNEINFIADYNQILIGSQVWSDSNLNVSTYRNGDIIPQVTDQTAWNNLTTGAWCYYLNDTGAEIYYGKLYNWYAVTDPRGLAPEGFHVPSDDEWKTLNDHIDSEKIKGVKKKVLREKHQYVDGDKIESRFKGLPGGARLIKDFGCYFSSIGFDGAWWSSSENVTKSDLYNTLNYFFLGGANDYSFNKQFGFSVRCIKD